MAVVLVEGFDAYNGISGNNGSVNAGGWIYGGNSGSLVAGRFGGQAFSKGQGSLPGYNLYKVFGSVTQGCVGFALKVSGYATDTSTALLYLTTDNLASQLSFRVGTSGEISIGRAGGGISGGFGTALGTTANGVVTLNTWVYVEIEFVISDSVGVVNLYVNGQSLLTLSGIDTKANATLSTVTTIYLGDNTSTSGKGACLYDDIYITDTATRLGEQKIETLYPTADTAQLQWTPSTGSNNYGTVDETLMSTTDYVSSSTVNNYDLYDFGNLSSTANTISAVVISSLVQKDNVGTRAIATTVKSGSSTTDSGNTYLGIGWTMAQRILATDPNTSAAWTTSGVNALQAGIKVIL